MEFDFNAIEPQIREFWEKNEVYRTKRDPSKPKCYVLDMFPYPSGAGLHVGHPLGYIASDIYARYKRLRGFNVLHPMGYDSFGLPAEQYAIQTGQHPAVTTEENINTFRNQLGKLGFSYDWKRELRTSDPRFYHWTQWIFIRLFHSWYNKTTDKAEPIDSLIRQFTQNGNHHLNAASAATVPFTADEWKHFTTGQQSEILLNYRLAYIADSWVNWCPALGTVLANDEVKDGVSERGGYPVERKLMKQWSLRITAYAERLLEGLNRIEWSEALKESQRNWIGRSEGCRVRFEVKGGIVPEKLSIEVFTTRPDTIFGVSFICLAPEHELIAKITTPEYEAEVKTYVSYARNRSERDRMAEVKNITGQFTGNAVIHPFTGQEVPIYVGEYVLATYGTGAVMGVPGHDARDHAFATHFGLPVVSILKDVDVTHASVDAREGTVVQSGFLNGLSVQEANQKAITEIEKQGIGERKVNFKLRDAIFGRQRYWGEPIPVWYDEEGIPHTVEEHELPVVLPEVDKYLPTEDGEPPLARAANWKYRGQFEYEKTTMPGWAGSSWYYLRYFNPENEKEFASEEDIAYWQNIDLYLGGDEHATGHLIYFRFWTKFLFDLGLLPFDEPAKKLVNQGKILGNSAIAYRLQTSIQMLADGDDDFSLVDLNVANPTIFLPKGIGKRMAEKIPSSGDEEAVKDFLKKVTSALGLETIHPGLKVNSLLWAFEERIPVEFVNEKNLLNVDAIQASDAKYGASFFLLEEGRFECGSQVEKMSKRWRNVIDPSEMVKKYGADTFRLYEMFLGPLEQHKPWDTKGIDGCFRFIRKLWRLFFDEEGKMMLTVEEPADEELKILHRTIKKAGEDIESLSFNTTVSAFMICVNELSQAGCHKRSILEPLLIILSPYAPYLTEYVWQQLGHKDSITTTRWPAFNPSLLEATRFEYPVAVNGKTRLKMIFPLDLPVEEIEREIVSAESLQKYYDGRQPKKVIIVKGRMINVVV